LEGTYDTTTPLAHTLIIQVLILGPLVYEPNTLPLRQ
jgi:hypothetical protein